MKPSEVKIAMEHAFEAGLVPFIWGEPGIGKSQVTEQVADKRYGSPDVAKRIVGMNKYQRIMERASYLKDIRVGQKDPVDLTGLPSITDDFKTKWCTPDFWPTDGEGMIFFDEANHGAKALQNAMHSVINDGWLGDWIKPPGWVIACAGNREQDRAYVNKMSTALSNRFFHIDYEIDHDEWIAWALENELDIRTIAFIRFRSNL